MAALKCGVWLGIVVFRSILPAVLITFGADASIIQGPENHTVPIGAIATFSCLAQGEYAFWKINNTALDDQRAMEYKTRGFVSSTDVNNFNSVYNLTMTVNALSVNNNTRITCVVYPPDHYTGIIIVIGPPPPPDPHLYMFSATTIQLSWLPPFSWAEYPILNYTVQVHNRATGDVINSTINAASTEMFSMTVPVTFIYNTPRVEVGQNCEELVFSVSAVNNIGWSSLAVVTGGFPMVPRLDTASIETMVAFQFDGTPLLLLSIQLPDICPFQELHYSITIQQITHPNNITLSVAGSAADNIIVIGPKTVVGRTNVNEVVNSSLAVDAVYSVLMEFDTLAGNVSSNATFGLNGTFPRQCSYPEIHSQPTLNYTDVIATTGAASILHIFKILLSVSNNGISLVEQIAAGVSVSLCIIITSAITMVLLVVCGFIYRRRTSDKRSVEKACDGMMPNPIYEGPLYERIRPEHNTFAVPQPTADVVESRYQESPNHQVVPTEVANKMENGTIIETACAPSQTSEEDKKESSGTEPNNDDHYTIMSPVGTLNSSYLHGGWGTPNSESFK